MSEIDRLIDNIDISNVSDIHITSGLAPMIRIDGALVNAYEDIIPLEVVEEYIREMIPDRFDQFLEDGEVDFKYNRSGVGNFRVNVYKCRERYAICLREIKEVIPKLKDLAIAPALKNFTELSDGLVLVTGPTGSGKSTTLAAMVNEINMTREKHIITLEEPIEYIYENSKSMVNQREIGQDTKSYSMGLRAALRQDPVTQVIKMK